MTKQPDRDRRTLVFRRERMRRATDRPDPFIDYMNSRDARQVAPLTLPDMYPSRWRQLVDWLRGATP